MNGLLGAALVVSGCLGIALLIVVFLLIARTTRSRDLAKRLADVEAQANAELSRARAQLARYQPLVDADAELARVRYESATLTHQLQTTRHSAQAEIQALQSSIFTLRQETGSLETEAYFQSYGLYTAKYDFETSEKYKQRLEWIRDQQKQMTKDNQAATCKTEWVVAGSTKDGRKMTTDYLKLMLRAFNGECDAAVMKVKHSNFPALADRIKKTYETLNKLGTVNTCQIMAAYLNLKLEELTLFHEYQQKLQDEREEQRAIQEQIRDEKRTMEELERAKKKAEEEEERYLEALRKAKAEVEQTTGAKQEKMMRHIAELEAKLAEAQGKQKAISLAQQTKAGHVYVISNLGSFGEHVYKIGMTRREDPMDRVKELGDASVPFPFDVHAIISTRNAPKLENDLHKLFAHRRLNTVNLRKEFFRVTLGEIEAAVTQHHGNIELTKVAEASEWRISVANRQHANDSTPSQAYVEEPRAAAVA